jgi:pimeloyl-ACP methyl ester carboxylesterase
MARELEQHAVSVGTGITLNVVLRPGAGTPAVCLHGIWDSWRSWAPLAEGGAGALDGRPLWMIDFRGHGGSSKPERGYSWADYATDIVALAREQDWPRFSLLGHSLGALVSLLVAAELPEQVDALVLEDPPLPIFKGPSDLFRPVYEMRAQSFEAIVDDFLVWRPWVGRERAEESATNLLQTADGVFQATFTGASDAVDVPVPGVVISAPALVIRAGLTEQSALQDAGVQLLRAALADMRLETIPDTSHTVLRDAPDAYRALLAEFFSEHA